MAIIHKIEFKCKPSKIAQAALDYAAHGWSVFPTNGKTPFADTHGFKDATTDPEKIQLMWERWPSANVAIATGSVSGILAVDVDGEAGETALRELQEKHGPLPTTRTIITRPGRRQLWFAQPPGIKTKSTAEVLGPKLDIRGDGGYVVAPPSIHPETRKPYLVSSNGDPAEAPEWLLALTRDVRPESTAGNSQDTITAGQRNAALTSLAGSMRRRGMSFEAIEAALQTENTQRCRPPLAAHEVTKIAQSVAKYDPTIKWPEVAALLQEFNEKYYIVEDIGGKCRVCWEEVETSFKLGKPLLNHQSFPDFRNRFMHQKVKVGEVGEGEQREPIYESKAKVWLGHPDRRQYTEVQFVPGADLGHGVRNLWRGFAFEPKPGDCKKYLAHVKNNICQGNQDHYDWLIRWMAYAVRHPAENGHVAVVIRGKKGVGKNVFAEAFNELWGRHGIVLSNEKHVTSNFNAHLLGKCSLVADEAFFAGDPRQVRLLKGLVTGETLAIESKGVNVIVAPNFLHITIIGNDNWLVSATGDERRFFALECGDRRRENHAYFAAIAEELQKGGYAALLDYLLNEVDLKDFNIRKAPHTDVLRDQMAESDEGAAGLWLECLQSGELPGVGPGDNFPPCVKNEDGTVWLHLGSLLKAAWKRNQKQWGRVTTKQLGAVLSKGKHSMGFKRAPRGPKEPRRWEIPALAECRALWDQMRYQVDWPDDGGEWDVS